MTARISLAQQIALLSEAAPADFDPEDLNPTGLPSEDEVHEEGAAAREHYVDVGPSSLRQLNHSISDPKYHGTRVSRKDLDASEVGTPDLINDGSEDEANAKVASAASASEDEATSEPLSPQSQPELHNPPHKVQHDRSNPSDLASTLRATRLQDREKGKAIVQQIVVWDALLDARIRLHKATSASNVLKSRSVYRAVRQEEALQQRLNAMLDEAAILSQDLFELQDSLSYAEASPCYAPRKRMKTSHDSHNHAEAFTSLSVIASELEASYHPHLIQILSKWSSKVQAVAPNVLLPANRSTFKNSYTDRTTSPGVIEVINETIHSDWEKLLSRTRSSDLEDCSGSEDLNPEVFDDTDFYQQLLRDVIEARGTGLNGEEAEPEWLRRQKVNKARRRKTVDVKASKGRKLRFQVHEKLQNFMVPMAFGKGSWHDEQIDELFTSLLGNTEH